MVVLSYFFPIHGWSIDDNGYQNFPLVVNDKIALHMIVHKCIECIIPANGNIW
jgi:hypothetical protein